MEQQRIILEKGGAVNSNAPSTALNRSTNAVRQQNNTQQQSRYNFNQKNSGG